MVQRASWWHLLVAAALCAAPLRTASALQILSVLKGDAFEPDEVAVYEAGNRLFVTDLAAPATLHVYDAQTLAPVAERSFAREIGALTVHQASGRLYLFDFDFGTIGADPPVMHVLDAATAQPLTSFAQGLGPRLVDESLGRVFVRDGWNLAAIDADDHARTTVAIAGCGIAAGFAINPVTHELFIGSLQCDTLYVVNGATLAVTPVPALRTRFLAANPQDNKVYGTTINYNGYWILDRDTNAAPAVTPCATDATELIYDPATNRVHTNAEINDDFVTIEGDDDSCTKTEIGAYTSGLGRLPAPSRVLQPASSYLAVIDEANRVSKLPIAPPEGQDKIDYSHAIAVHAGLRRVFLTTFQFGNDHSQDGLTVLQDSTAPAPLPTVASAVLSTPYGNLGSVRVAVYGSGFVPGASVMWDGFFTGNPDSRDMPTTWLGAGELRAFVPRNSVVAETVDISVRSPGPGGGTSNQVQAALVNHPFFVLPPNDDFADATPIIGPPFTHSAVTLSAGIESLDPDPPCQPGGASTRSVWYRHAATADGQLTLDTFRSSYDTILQVVSGDPGAFVAVACNDDALGTAQSQVSFATTAGTTYHAIVTSYDGSGGTLEFHARDALDGVFGDGFEPPPL